MPAPLAWRAVASSGLITTCHALMRALKHIIHDDGSADDAIELLGEDA